MADRAVKDALYEGFAEVAPALASGGAGADPPGLRARRLTGG